MNFTSKLKSFKIETDRRNFDKKFIFLLILLLLFAFATVAVVVTAAAAAAVVVVVTTAVVIMTAVVVVNAIAAIFKAAVLGNVNDSDVVTVPSFSCSGIFVVFFVVMFANTRVSVVLLIDFNYRLHNSRRC